VQAAGRARENERRQHALVLTAREAELRALSAQLEPHFLLNTLNSVLALVDNRPADARLMIERLSELLKAAFDEIEEPEVPLGRELDLLSAYLGIEQVRFGDRLRVTIDADHAACEARVPPFLVQPLAENAIQHGIAPRASGGAVTLRAVVRGGNGASTLVLELSDDGVGMPDDAREGIGLRITRQRLQTLYRGAGALSVLPRPGGGTIATIELPFASAVR
jgi:LytS/YehU family sensor histidine kinase